MTPQLKTSNLPKIGITQGDINGIGYEVILKVLCDSRIFEGFIPIVYGQSGLDSLEASQAVATGKNLIVVRGFEGQTVTVSTADGKVVANGKADSDRETISVPAGVYVVKAGSKSVKVIVK